MSPLLIAAATFASVVLGVVGCCLAVLDIQTKAREMDADDRVKLQQRLLGGMESLEGNPVAPPVTGRGDTRLRQTLSTGTAPNRLYPARRQIRQFASPDPIRLARMVNEIDS